MTIKTLSAKNLGDTKVTSVTLLGHSGELEFNQTASGLEVSLPASPPCDYAYGLRIQGVDLNALKTTLAAKPGKK